MRTFPSTFDLDSMDTGDVGTDGYSEMTVIIDGALESVTYWTSNVNLPAWTEYWTPAQGEKFVVEIYELAHGHEFLDGECDCVQFLTDHRPSVTFNA